MNTFPRLQESTTATLLRSTADQYPSGLALIDAQDPAQRWSWAALLAAATDEAHRLAGAERPGSVQAIWAASEPAWVVLELACHLAGLVVQPIDPALEPAAVAAALRRTGARRLAVAASITAEARRAATTGCEPLRTVFTLGDSPAGPRAVRLPDVSPRMAAFILPTSGTTGPPKGAVLSQRAVTADARLVAQRMGLRADDAWVSLMPLHRSGGCATTVLACAATGATIVAAPTWAPDAALSLVDTLDATVLSAFPRALEALVETLDKDSPRRGRLRLVQTGGAPVTPELVRAVAHHVGARLSVVYGLTEAAPVLTQTDQTDADDDPAASVGRPLPGTEVVVVDPVGGGSVPAGTIGEVTARGPQLMDGYVGDRAASARVLDAHGWLHTGDAGWLDDDGRLHIEGRLADMIVRDGRQWLPGPVERVLTAAPGVAEAAVVAASGVVVAFVRRRPGANVDAAQLKAAVRDHRGPEYTPDEVMFVEEFPALPSGKVRRHLLRERLVRGAA
jgi:fatty-acyl-CoA synthase